MFKTRIVSPEKTLFSGEAEKVTVSTIDGELTLMEFHQPLISRLSKGNIIIDKKRNFKILDGIVFMSNKGCAIIVETY